MKKAFKKVEVLILSLLLIASVLPFSVMAADVIDVELDGINVAAAEGTTGTGAAAIGEDYTTVLTASEGYEIFSVMIYGIGSAPSDVYHPSFEFDYETGVLTVSKNQLNRIECLEIYAKAGRFFDYESDVTDVSEFPYSDTFTLAETDVTTDFDYATKFFKVDLALGDGLEIKFYGTDNIDADSLIAIYSYNEESGLEEVTRFDHDRLGRGEDTIFVPEEQGTYYVATKCYDNYVGESYTLEMDIVENATALPNFIEKGHENLSGYLWNWNAETKTLTLTNGFETTNYAGNGISLPAGSTVVASRGGHFFISAEGYGIYCEGELNIELDYASLNIESTYDAIVTEKGDITITGSRYNGDIDAEINLNSSYGIYIYEDGDVNIDNCKINMECEYDGIAACCGDINIIDSDVTILSDYGYGIVSYDPQIAGVGNVNVNGGRLQIVSYEATLKSERGYVNLDNVALFLAVENVVPVVSPYNIDSFTIPGRFAMLDAEGNYIIEDEIWTEDYLRPMTGVHYPDGSFIIASAIVTVAEAEQNNTVSGIEEEYVQGESICIDAESEVLEYPVMGNTSWFPTGWKIVDTDLEGIFYSGWVSVSTDTLEPGEYVVEVIFEKHVSFGDQWYPDGENVEVIPISFTITEKSTIDEDPSPTPTPGEGSDDISGTDDELDVILPDVETEVPPTQNIETPEIPDTSFDNNAAALAVLSLTVGGALILTFKRNKTK